MTPTLLADARNRAVRTLVQNLGVDVGVAVVALLLPVVTSAESLDDVQWGLIAFSVAKTIVVTIFSYVMRRYLDPSKVPTPLPPDDSGEPTEDDELYEPAPEARTAYDNYQPQRAKRDANGNPIF